MKVKALINLGDEYGIERWQTDEVFDLEDEKAQKGIAKGHVEETSEPLTKRAARSKSKATKEELEEMTVVDLRDKAHKEGIDLHGATAKDDIIKAVKKGPKKEE